MPKVVRTNNKTGKDVVVEIYEPHYVENNTDWLKRGIPEPWNEGDKLISLSDDTEVYVNDIIGKNNAVDTLNHTRVHMKELIANNRFRAETGGIEVGGMKIDTSRESQALITGAALQANIDKNYTCQWKSENGFVTLTNENILAVAIAVRQHVQNCFNKEQELATRVDKAKTEDALKEIPLWE